jgi:Spy/CpxP family protein refolding chaperone
MTKRILFVGLACATLTFAQGKKRGGQNTDDSPMMAHAANRLEQMSDILKLDKDEKKQVKTIMDDAQKEAVPVRDQMDKGRLSVAQAVSGGKQGEIDAAVKSYGAAESQMSGIEMNAFAKVYQALDKDQQAKSPQIFPMFLGIFKGKNWMEPGQH